MKTTCPCCGQTIKPVAQIVTQDTAQMSDRELYAYYKRTAPVSDLAFTRRNASDALKARIDAIVKPNAKDAALMREARRIELSDANKAAGIAPLGSPRWAEQRDLAAAEASIQAA